LIAIIWILLSMTELFLFGQSLPLAFLFDALPLPLLTDDLGDLRVRETWITSDDIQLMVLSIQDEGYCN